MRSTKNKEDWLELEREVSIIKKILTKLFTTVLPNVHGGEK